jgi:hypothetical protein
MEPTRPDKRRVGGSPPAPAEASSNFIDYDVTIKSATPTEAAEGGLGILGKDCWGWAEARVGQPRPEKSILDLAHAAD